MLHPADTLEIGSAGRSGRLQEWLAATAYYGIGGLKRTDIS